MAMVFLDEVLSKYISAHQEMMAAEQVDADNLIVSFPLHFVGRHRVEVSVTRAASNLYILSDIGRTIGELKQYGYTVSRKLVDRMIEIAKPSKVRIVNENLIMECEPKEIGVSLHVFAEAIKTIGDAYLAYRVKIEPDRKLIDAVGQLLSDSHFAYKPDFKISGRIEKHSVNFYLPPNGHQGPL